MLNIGLLLPQQVLDKAIDAAIEYNVPLNSLEGFVRQIVGWREFIRAVYEREGRLQRTKIIGDLTAASQRVFGRAQRALNRLT